MESPNAVVIFFLPIHDLPVKATIKAICLLALFIEVLSGISTLPHAKTAVAGRYIQYHSSHRDSLGSIARPPFLEYQNVSSLNLTSTTYNNRQNGRLHVRPLQRPPKLPKAKPRRPHSPTRPPLCSNATITSKPFPPIPSHSLPFPPIPSHPSQPQNLTPPRASAPPDPARTTSTPNSKPSKPAPSPSNT